MYQICMGILVEPKGCYLTVFFANFFRLKMVVYPMNELLFVEVLYSSVAFQCKSCGDITL